MVPFRLPLLALALCGLASPAQTPKGTPLPLENPGFEQAQASGLPASWTGSPAPGVRMAVTRAFKAEGQSSLQIEHPAPGAKTTVLSAPVKLQVGQLYRLSAWIKTQGVKADPQARYPTALGACVSMASHPFTNNSPTVAGDSERRVEYTFFATTANDRVQLHLGRNGLATGSAWFDDIRLEKVDDIAAHIPLETVRWAGRGFRYQEGGWTFLHIEGEPYERGRQHGELMAAELAAFLDKLAIVQDRQDPVKGWAGLRKLADALTLRKFDTEYLEEMKGIADGANKGGAKFRGRELDVLDIVTLNSAIDFSSLDEGLRTSATPLSGRNFFTADDEVAKAGKGDHCSAFVATKSATKDGRFVTGQMFMWNGYTGVHWDVMLDVVPTKGQRVVMQTFPGGIHSGTDWYVTGGGLVIGETTVAQTPFDPEGTPQSNRIRKAAQYAKSIDEFASILKTKNNGLYTNDWTVADTKTDEGAVFLLGTKQSKLWRTGIEGKKGAKADTPGNLKDFIWANNNNRDLEVRKETIPNPDNAPVDLTFNTWNRDIAFWDWFKAKQGKIDLTEAVEFWASSPVQRPHACDGKLTTAEMAEQLMFIAHQGKTTHREKWVGGRFIADLPNAVPHLTYGYTTFSPVFVTEKLQAAHAAFGKSAEPAPAPKLEPKEIAAQLGFPKSQLWTNTVVPASDADNWFNAGSAAYYGLLKRMPSDPVKNFEAQRDALEELNTRCNYWILREGALIPAKSRTDYGHYNAYQIPRIRGTFLLHQLRLALGNAPFAKLMDTVQTRFNGKPMATEDFIKALNEVAGKDYRAFVTQWTNRQDLPALKLAASVKPDGDKWEVKVDLSQVAGDPYHLFGSLEFASAKLTRLMPFEIRTEAKTITFTLPEKPTQVRLNAGADFPVKVENPFAWANQLEHFDKLLLVHGTSHQVEANRSLALLYQHSLAEAMTEVLPELKSDAEVTAEELRSRDLVVFGGPEENGLLARLVAEQKLPVTFAKGAFIWQGKTFASPDEGLVMALPNPWNPERVLYLMTANTRLQLWQMVKGFQRGIPAWGRFKGGELVAKGSFPTEKLTVKLD